MTPGGDSPDRRPTDKELLYAASARCQCRAGLAYPLDHEQARRIGAWKCSRVLKGEAPDGTHDEYPWAFYKIREETSIRNSGGITTRPHGTICKTVGAAVCPKCQHRWESEPYVACGLSHHWLAGSCPKCSYAVGGEGSWSSEDGPGIVVRYREIVLDEGAPPRPSPGKDGHE